ncbi:sulfate transporter CysZ [Immundisolibacter sp.]|uniref:sulfate transporter CysZ n=1 Tax=Immundisolibacter sp. TaxID=1934948 RepID=UPI00262A3267|nr:sulfate transporter CysZ [Immundisolibacter sp.]MDD3651689.1 sulfate transporter CysZ [Immundisolibacter sp.]
MSPLSGAACLWRGFTSLFDRRWRSLVLAPLAINAVLFAAGGVWAARRTADAVSAWQAALPDWLGWLTYLAWPLFAVALVLVCVYGFTAVANLIGAPFNTALAARVLGEPPAGGRGAVAEALASIGNELRKLGYFLLRAVPLGVLLWVPGVNLVAGPLWLLLGAWLLALEYLDYPLAHRGLDFPAVRRAAAARRGPALGFGAAALLAGMLPGLNLLLMPAAVIGACVLVREQAVGAGR